MSIQSNRSRLSEKLKQKEAKRRSKQAELMALNEKISSMYGGKDLFLKQEQLRLRQLKQEEEERLRLELIEKKRAEDERKTKAYFEFNKYDRRIAMEGGPVYFGDFITKSTAWFPHGKGIFTVFGSEVLNGKFVKGDFVDGIVRFSDGDTWDGHVEHHRMHGVGLLITQDGIQQEVIARDNEIVCFKSELTNGLHIQFHEQFNNIYPALNRKPVATVLKHVREWIYLLKFHDEVWPEDREIDLSRYSSFSIVRDRPHVYSLQGFDLIQTAHSRVDDYRLRPKYDRRAVRDSAANRLNDEQELDRLRHLSATSISANSEAAADWSLLLMDDDLDDSVVTAGTRMSSSTSNNCPSSALKSPYSNKLSIGSSDSRSTNGASISSFTLPPLQGSSQRSITGDRSSISGDRPKPLYPDGVSTAADDDDNISMYTDISETTYHSTVRPVRFNNSSRFTRNPNSLPSLLRRISEDKQVIPPPSVDASRKYVLSETSRLIPRFPNRDHVERGTNIFEARAIGVGSTREADEQAKQVELKKRQFAVLIQERQAKQEEERQRQIAEQQQQFLQKAMEDKHEEEQAKKEEMDQLLKDTRAAVEDELSILSKNTALSRVDEFDQLKTNKALRSMNLSKLAVEYTDLREEDQVTTLSRSSALSRAEDLAAIAEHPFLSDSNLQSLSLPIRRPWRFRDEDELSVASQVSLMSIAEEVERVADADYVHV